MCQYAPFSPKLLSVRLFHQSERKEVRTTYVVSDCLSAWDTYIHFCLSSRPSNKYFPETQLLFCHLKLSFLYFLTTQQCLNIHLFEN